MPLRVPSCGKHGYWFYPAWLLPEGTEFELVVEGSPAEVAKRLSLTYHDPETHKKFCGYSGLIWDDTSAWFFLGEK